MNSFGRGGGGALFFLNSHFIVYFIHDQQTYPKLECLVHFIVVDEGEMLHDGELPYVPSYLQYGPTSLGSFSGHNVVRPTYAFGVIGCIEGHS